MFTDSYFLIMVFVDITEDNISELMKSKDSKSTQRAVTQSIKLFRDFLIQKMNLENLKLTQIKNWMRCWDFFMHQSEKKMVKWWKKSSVNLLLFDVLLLLM